jgi:hypothetical protein
MRFTHFGRRVLAKRIPHQRNLRAQPMIANEMTVAAFPNSNPNSNARKRHSFRPIATGFALTLFLLTETLAAEDRLRPTTVRVPQDAATIQAAIDRVADGGTVEISHGIYSETVDIIGKRVDLVGAGSKGRRLTEIWGAVPRELLPLSEARGLINYGPGGGGLVKDIVLDGGDVGILGTAHGRDESAHVRITDVVLLQNGHGIAGGFGELSLSDASMRGNLGNGILLVCFEDLDLADVVIANAGQAGILAYNCNNEETIGVTIDNSHIIGNQASGAVLVGNMNVIVHDCVFLANSGTGIFLFGTKNATIFDTLLGATFQGDVPPFHNLGYGLAAKECEIVLVLASTVQANSIAGLVFVDGTEGRVGLTDIQGHPYGVVLQDGASFFDLGGNDFSNNMLNFLTDGDLPIPDPPEIPDM